MTAAARQFLGNPLWRQDEIHSSGGKHSALLVSPGCLLLRLCLRLSPALRMVLLQARSPDSPAKRPGLFSLSASCPLAWIQA